MWCSNSLICFPVFLHITFHKASLIIIYNIVIIVCNNKWQKWNTTPQLAEGIMADLWRDLWIHETGTGQQVAQLHERYMMMIMINDREGLLNFICCLNSPWASHKYFLKHYLKFGHFPSKRFARPVWNQNSLKSHKIYICKIWSHNNSC